MTGTQPQQYVREAAEFAGGTVRHWRAEWAHMGVPTVLLDRAQAAAGRLVVAKTDGQRYRHARTLGLALHRITRYLPSVPESVSDESTFVIIADALVDIVKGCQPITTDDHATMTDARAELRRYLTTRIRHPEPTP